MSEKGAERSIKNMKESNISKDDDEKSVLEKVIHKNKQIEKVKELEEEKKSVATSPDAP